MKTIISQLKKALHIETGEDISRAVRSFSLGQRLIWGFFLVLFFVGIIGIIKKANDSLLVTVPAHGGSFTEGIIGVPRFVNPVLAASDADRDMTSLVYSGLMRIGTDGTLIPDLAKSYSISEDGLTYTFTLKPNLVWQDSLPLTTEDIEFTVQKVQDALLKSPHHASWQGITIERPSDTQISFHLKQPFPGFLENTTLGILPKHLWKTVTTDAFSFSTLNTHAIGSGPFKVTNVSVDQTGIPQVIEMAAFSHFALGEPYIATVRMRFYTNEETRLAALNNNEIDAMAGVSPGVVGQIKRNDTSVTTATLPRVFAVFFNQSQAPLFSNKVVRQALDLALDKNKLVQDVFQGYGVPISGPIPPGSIGFEGASATSTPAQTDHLAEAKELLAKNGWTMDQTKHVLVKIEKNGKTVTKTTELAFSLATSDAPDLKHTAELVQKTWQALGAKVDLTVYEQSDLNQMVIRPRHYDALFFGEIVGREPDLFSFWHSSQRNDPGLNIALYTSVQADKVLEQIRTTTNTEERLSLYEQVARMIQADAPAVFVYSPDFLYVAPKTVVKSSLSSIVINSERFSNAYQWYMQTEKIWTIFLPQ